MRFHRIAAAAVAVATIALLSACAVSGSQHAPSASTKDGKEQCVYTTGSNVCRKVPAGS
jgi:hypothetical protein